MAESNEVFVLFFSGPSFISLMKCVHSSPQPFEVLEPDLVGRIAGTNGDMGRTGDTSLTSEGGLGRGFSTTFWVLALLFSLCPRNDEFLDILLSSKSSAKALTL
jgi:hypothetical protein